MTKPNPPDGSRGRRRSPIVVGSSGSRSRFLRGMITHDLVTRGLDFDTAYAVAQRARAAFEGRDEVATDEIRALIDGELEAIDEALVQRPELPWQPGSQVRVISRGQEQPFSKGLLAETLHGSGVEPVHAYRIVAELESQLHDENVTLLSTGEIGRRVAELLDRHEGRAATERYRVLRNIHRLPKPVVVYIGGASGTGKSSLALELAPMLRIYRVIATDTIRQVMRMVFTPSILPALHRSSFEMSPRDIAEYDMGPAGDQDDRELVIANYEEQAARVLVGVRAVVERAISESMSVIVEGVHVRPGSVPFADLEGSCYQVPIVLGSLDDEAHRRRMLRRSHGDERRADRYVRALSAIRIVNDHLLDLAEANDIPLLDSFRDEQPEAHAVQLLAGALARQLPALARGESLSGQKAPTLLLIIDGLADRPVRALGGRTPLQAANTPTFDRLAREGAVGLADPVGPGIVPDTAAGSLALFGQSPVALKRGPVEALGAGIHMQAGDVALRANLATVDDNGNVVDRRAGRVREEAKELARALDAIELPGEIGERVSVRVKAGTEHRLAVLLHGDDLSTAIEGSDPGDAAIPGAPVVPHALDPSDERAVFTAAALAAFEREAATVLAKHPANRKRAEHDQPVANAVLTRGAGRIHNLVRLEDAGLPLRLCCISGDRTVLGLARWLGADIVSQPGMTSNLDTDLGAKFAAAGDAIRQNDLTVMHVKGADIAAHDRRPDLKVAFLERLDRELGRFLDQVETPVRVAIASDHATLSESGQHGADPLPVLIWGPGQAADSVQMYDELAAAAGSLGRFPLQSLLSKLYQLS